MFARVFSFQSVPQKRPAIEAMADNMYAFVKTLDGFISATYMVSGDERHYSSVTLWQTKEDAIAAGDAIRERSATALEDLLTAPPEMTINEVYEPKG